VQYERQPFRRSQRLQHHLQRQPHRVGQEHLLLRVDGIFAADHRIRQAGFQ
jgi:hypothetical protein